MPIPGYREKVLALLVIIRFITCMEESDAPTQQNLPPTPLPHKRRLSVELLQAVAEEEVWLAGQLSVHTRRAYKQDVGHFVATMGIRSADDLRRVTRAAVVAWQNRMREEGAK